MGKYRYWGLFWIAMGMAAHSLIVGRLLGSSFFMLVFFWGWVAAAAYRRELQAAQAMVIPMIFLLVTTTVAMALLPAHFPQGIGYLTFALYPAIVSWVCVFFYIRHLQRKEDRAMPGERSIA